MITTPFIRDCIVDKEKTHLIHRRIAAGTSQYGMQTFDQSIFGLFEQGLVTYDEALRWASNKDEFKLKVQGISTTVRRDARSDGARHGQPAAATGLATDHQVRTRIAGSGQQPAGSRRQLPAARCHRRCTMTRGPADTRSFTADDARGGHGRPADAGPARAVVAAACGPVAPQGLPSRGHRGRIGLAPGVWRAERRASGLRARAT